ncbi:MAG: response regulator [Thermodesulfobacteriota bacterium]|nr:response regulator [Thermodesulfobacteriota bacterium]
MNSETVLIVDDDPAIRELVSETISLMGLRCLSAPDGNTALDLIRKNDLGIIISDIKMPLMDGLTLMNRVKEERPGIAFIIITGFAGEYSYERIIEAGANDFIKKPFTIDELKSKLRRIITERRLKLENQSLVKKQAALNEQLSTLLSLSSDLTSELDFERLFPLIIGKVTEAMSAERTSLYVIDWEKKELWTKVAEQVDQIRLPLGQGISGRVAATGKRLNVTDAWELSFFKRKFDRKNNFRTKSVLCLPITNRVGERIGVIQVINKKGDGRFKRHDEIFLRGLTSQVGIALENALLHEELRLSFEQSITTLSATVDARHPLTAGHSQRVTSYSLMVAREMSLSEEDIEILKYAAMLHDIGKIGIRDDILLKNGLFTTSERAEMKTHPDKTKVILENFRFPRNLHQVPEIAANHHEKVNGEGYPNGLKGNQLPLGSKIMAVADVFDALTSPRDYPKYTADEILDCSPMPLDKAVSILKSEAGAHFDPKVVNVFLDCLPKALLLHRGEHFSQKYVNETISSIAPDLLPKFKR